MKKLIVVFLTLFSSSVFAGGYIGAMGAVFDSNRGELGLLAGYQFGNIAVEAMTAPNSSPPTDSDELRGMAYLTTDSDNKVQLMGGLGYDARDTIFYSVGANARLYENISGIARYYRTDHESDGQLYLGLSLQF